MSDPFFKSDFRLYFSLGGAFSLTAAEPSASVTMPPHPIVRLAGIPTDPDRQLEFFPENRMQFEAGFGARFPEWQPFLYAFSLGYSPSRTTPFLDPGKFQPFEMKILTDPNLELTEHAFFINNGLRLELFDGVLEPFANIVVGLYAYTGTESVRERAKKQVVSIGFDVGATVFWNHLGIYGRIRAIDSAMASSVAAEAGITAKVF